MPGLDFVTLSELDDPESSAAGKSNTGVTGATVSYVIANQFDNPLLITGQIREVVSYCHKPCRPSAPRPPNGSG